MKKLLLPMLLVVLLASCAPGGKDIEVGMFGSRGDQYFLLYDVAESGLMAGAEAKVVQLAEPSKEINPGTGFARGGEFFVTTDSDSKMATFGKAAYHTVTLPDGKITLNCFKVAGENSIAFGSDFSSKVWALQGEADPVLVAEIQYRKVKTPEGEERNLLMRKGEITGDKWIGDAGGKIYQEGEDGVLSQIGFVEWRLIKLENGKPMTILMAKDMTDGAKWRGRFNDVIYLDK